MHFCSKRTLAQSFSINRTSTLFLIVGGLYSVTALREDDQERFTVYTKHLLRLHSQTTLTNNGGLKNLDTRGDSGWVGKIVLHWGERGGAGGCAPPRAPSTRSKIKKQLGNLTIID